MQCTQPQHSHKSNLVCVISIISIIIIIIIKIIIIMMIIKISISNTPMLVHSNGVTCNSYNMATRALADLSPEGTKRPRAINQSSARGAML